MNFKKLLGIILLAAVVVSVLVAQMVDWDSLKRTVPVNRPAVTVQIMYGGEKTAFLENQAVRDIFRDRYELTLDARRVGSIEMVSTADTSSMDCLWPSNQIAVELARLNGKPVLGDEIIFNSPIVFYTWGPVTEALTKAGIVERRGETHYVVKAKELITMVSSGTTWESLGLNLYGSVAIYSTDPTRSNSGNMWAGWLANQLNGGKVATEADLATLLPLLRNYFDQMGFMEVSSGDIFEIFLSQGMGSRPIIVGYENQLPEFILANPQARALIEKQIDVLYPEPTVFASHPVISLTADCARLVEALRDPEIQAIAWRDHGLRSGLIGVQNDPSLFTGMGMPATVDRVMSMPGARVMERIIAELSE